jgi:hypothetical protein
VEDEAGTLTVEEDGSERSIRLTEGTKIWLDRSRLGQPSLDGKLSDLATGLNVEVRSFGPERPDVAYWIKARVATP